MEKQIDLENEKTCSYCFELVSFDVGKKPVECPYCGKRGWKKPKTERYCFYYQKLYFHYRELDDKFKADKYLSQLHKLLSEYAEGMIKAKINGVKKFNFDDLKEKSNDVAFLVIQEYLKKPEFSIETSFGGFMNFKIRQVLYSKEQQFQDDLLSLNYVVESDKEMIDMLETIEHEQIYNQDFGAEYFIELEREKELVDSVWSIIDGVSQELTFRYGGNIAINYKLAMKSFVDGKGRIHIDNFCTMHEGLELKVIVDDSIDAVRELLLNYNR